MSVPASTKKTEVVQGTKVASPAIATALCGKEQAESNAATPVKVSLFPYGTRKTARAAARRIRMHQEQQQRRTRMHQEQQQRRTRMHNDLKKSPSNRKLQPRMKKKRLSINWQNEERQQRASLSR